MKIILLGITASIICTSLAQDQSPSPYTPSRLPFDEPTYKPSAVANYEPTDEPTYKPSAVANYEHTFEPSRVPFDTPSRLPINAHTFTFEPSSVPFDTPSRLLINVHTYDPSAVPFEMSTVITPSDTCGTCPLVGEKYIPTFGCEVFYSCEDRELRRCPAGLLFDVDAQLCNWPGDFTCTCTETTTSTPTSSAPTMNTDMPTMFVPTLEKPTPFPTDTPTSIASGGVTKTSNPTPGETEMPTTFFNPSTEIPTTMPTESPTLLNTELPTVLIDNDTPAPTGLGSVFWFPNAYNGGGPDVCVFDNGGLELPAATPKFATRQECCLGFYAWNFRECMGNNGPTNRYFPNWTREEGSSDVCLLDDGTYVVPEGTPQYETVQECCENHYSWNLDACNNVENEPSYKYFPNWDGNGYVCFLDDGTHVVPDSAPLFDDLTSCCDSQYSWNTAQCNSVYGPSYKYFPNLHGVEPICFFDDGGFTLPFAVIDDDDDAAIDIPFGAPLYDDIRSCCDAQYPWARDECISYHYM